MTGGRRDYAKYNYCNICEDKYPKTVILCDWCKQKLRTVAHNKGSSARYRERLKKLVQKI